MSVCLKDREEANKGGWNEEGKAWSEGGQMGGRGPDPVRPGRERARAVPPRGMGCCWNSLPGTEQVHNKRTLKR